MLKLAVGALALALATLPAGAQTASPNAADPMNKEATPNSGVGVTGQPGHQAGPAPKTPAETTGANPGEASKNTPDAAKVPGLPGGKSGPPERKNTGTSK